MAISSSRNVSHFAKFEAAYGVAEGLAAADYLRVMAANVQNSQLAGIPSQEGTPGRDRFELFPGRPTSALSVTTLFRGAPTGVTPPVHGRLIESAMGGDDVVVNALGVITGASGGIYFVADSADGMFRPIAGGENSPLIPLSGNAVYKSVVYPLSAAHKSLTYRYQPLEAGATPKGAPAQLLTGWKVNQLTISFDSSGSPGTMAFEGPAARTYHGVGRLQDGGAGDNVDIPATVAGDQPLNGIPSKVWFRRHGSSSAWSEVTNAFRTFTLTLSNNQVARNDESGSLYSTGVIDDENRTTTVMFTTYAEEDQALYPDVRAGLAAGEAREYSLFFAFGNQIGSRGAVYVPRWKPDMPSGDDGNRIVWTFSGECLADSPRAGNSSVVIGLG